MDSPLGINSKWIDTYDNFITDKIHMYPGLNIASFVLSTFLVWSLFTPTEVHIPSWRPAVFSAFIRRSIHDMDYIVDQEIAKSKPSKEIKIIVSMFQWAQKKVGKELLQFKLSM